MSKNKTLSPKQKLVRKIIKWVLLISAIIIAYAFLRNYMWDNFPRQMENPVEFSEHVVFSVNMPDTDYSGMEVAVCPLENGDLLYVASQYVSDESVEQDGTLFLYMISPTYDVTAEKQLNLEKNRVDKVFELNNGHFAFLMKNSNKKVLREYDTDFSLINERTFDLMSGLNSSIEFYHDGYYYAGKGENLIKYDENFNVIETYSKDAFPGCDRIYFIQDYEGNAYICAPFVTDNNEDEYADKYILRPAGGGNDINLNLGNNITADGFGIMRGNADYPFLIISGKYNDTLSRILGADLYGNVLYGIDKNGDAKKLIVTEAMPFSEYRDMDNYYNGVPHGDNHYFADGEYWSPDSTYNLYLYENKMKY
jgi:hypothetical protein